MRRRSLRVTLSDARNQGVAVRAPVSSLQVPIRPTWAVTSLVDCWGGSYSPYFRSEAALSLPAHIAPADPQRRHTPRPGLLRIERNSTHDSQTGEHLAPPKLAVGHQPWYTRPTPPTTARQAQQTQQTLTEALVGGNQARRAQEGRSGCRRSSAARAAPVPIRNQGRLREHQEEGGGRVGPDADQQDL